MFLLLRLAAYNAPDRCPIQTEFRSCPNLFAFFW